MEPIETKLVELQTSLNAHFAKATEQEAQTGAVLSETKTAIEAIRAEMKAAQTQLDAMDAKLAERHVGGDPDQAKSIGEQYTQSEDYKGAKASDFAVMRHKDGRIRTSVVNPFAGRKSIITTVGLGTGTTGVQMPTRLPGVTGLAQQELRVRDLMGTPVPMTSGNSFDYVRQVSRSNGASPQVESSPKAESTYTWESKSDTVKTIAHFTNASRQAIEDVPWLQALIDSELMYGLLLKEESEILAGDGTGQHLNGLITQATAYNAGLNVASDTQLDKLRHAKLQARLAGLGTFAPDGLVLNPTDMEKIELIKTEEGGANKGVYIIGDPKAGTAIKFVWNLPVVESDSIAAGTFLLGAFQTAAQLIDRLAAMVELSYEHATNFTQNLVTILAEERIGLAVRRPEAFITGAL